MARAINDAIAIPDTEDPELRSEVNGRLTGIYNDGDFNLFSVHRPVVVEAMGTRAHRLAILENALEMG